MDKDMFFFAPPRSRGGSVLNKQGNNPRVQQAGLLRQLSLALVDAVVVAPTADLVEIEILIYLGVALVCFACVGARLPLVPDEVKYREAVWPTRGVQEV